MEQGQYYGLRDALRVLRDVLPALAANTTDGPDAPTQDWLGRLRRTVLPAIDFDLPVLLVAICGGGSTGKSTLLNTLAGRPLARVGFRAGLTERVLLVGHPSVLSSADVAEALLHRLGERPVPWRRPEDTATPGPPLYATSEAIPPGLLVMDTPDFDTGDLDRMVNRERAEPVLRTAEVLIYVFTNTVYNNLSNTRFMADVVGGIGGRPTVLVYRITRTAPDDEVLAHCELVARHLYERTAGPAGSLGPGRQQVVGIYRMHESDAVALGESAPALVPIGEVTAGRPLGRLLADLDVTALKRHALAGDLAAVRQGAWQTLAEVEKASAEAALYRAALEHVMAEHALQALTAFPAHEAISLTVAMFLQTSPATIRLLRGVGRAVSAPLRAAQAVGRRIAQWSGAAERPPAPVDVRQALSQSLLEAANSLRNRLLEQHLVVSVPADDPLYVRAREAALADGSPAIEPLGADLYNLHFPAPVTVRGQESALRQQDWPAISAQLQAAVPGLVGLPDGIADELRGAVRGFREAMTFGQRAREAFFASLTALPPILGVTYALATSNPVAGTGLWIQVESLFGLNDLWALVSIPASLGLSEQDRRQLEVMMAPVFRLWLDRRVATIMDLFARTVCRPALEALDAVPSADDPRLEQVAAALRVLDGQGV